MSVVGLGLDLVGLAGFEEQLADPASGFVDATFTPAEQRAASTGAGRRTERLAGRFAAKEAFVKAWASARFGRAPALDAAALDLRQVEVVVDAYGRPSLRLHGDVAVALDALAAEVGALTAHVAITHDPPVAAAVVTLST